MSMDFLSIIGAVEIDAISLMLDTPVPFANLFC